MRITFKRHWNHLFQLILITLGVLVVMWFLEGKNPNYIDYITYIVTLLVLGIIPTLVVHTNYFLKNRHYDLEITKSELQVSVKGKKYKIRPENTSKVRYVISPEMYETRTVWLPWNYYRHVEIYMKDGNKFIITSLLTDDFSWLFYLEFEYETKIGLYRLA